MFIDPAAPITRKKIWPGYVLLRLRSPRIAGRAKPGQFLMVRVSDQPYPLLRRPLSIHARDGDSLELFFARAGLGTRILADKRAGENLDIIGPLGKGFSLPGRVKGKTCALVGALPRIFYGGKSEVDLPLLRKLSSLKSAVFISTDDGSAGFPGLVTAMLEKELARSSRPALICACGPDAMMKRVGKIAAERGIPAQLSLESIMGCGIGACWGCVHKIRTPEGDEWVKICEEGPVFPSDKVVWAEAGGG
jgi:dihydroorotate dehydrogenase electron transfer subunit